MVNIGVKYRKCTAARKAKCDLRGIFGGERGGVEIFRTANDCITCADFRAQNVNKTNNLINAQNLNFSTD